MILVGIDGGGTKTELLAADETGRVFARQVVGGCNFYSVQLAGIRSLLTDATQALLSPHGLAAADVSCAVVGMPVVEENLALEQDVTQFLSGLFPDHLLCNDARVGLAGSLGGAVGINVICGTGSICAGTDGTRYMRCGGWSGQFCDEGSCHWLGRRTLELFTKQADGRLPRTALYSLVKERFSLERDLDITYIINHVLANSRDRMAALQRVLALAMEMGDESAEVAYRQAAGEIASMVHTVHAGLDLPEGGVTVSYAGGLFQVPALLPMVRDALGGQYIFQTPQYSPAQGALILAAQRCLPQVSMPGFLSNLRAMPNT